MRRRAFGLVLLLLAAMACGWLVWDEIEASGILDRGGDPDAARRARRHAARDAELEAERLEHARLVGLPGVETAQVGSGRVVGEVFRYLPDVGPAPLPGVSVRLVGGEVRPETETDAEGAFAFEALPAQLGYALVVDHPPFKEVVLRGLGVRRDRTTDVGRVLLGGPTSLTGEVVDAAGRAVAGARVQVFFDRRRTARLDLRRALFELQGAMSPLAEARAHSDGRFHVENLPPGRYVIRVSAPGYATAFRAGVWVTADERAPVLEVVLDRGAGYQGRITDVDGRGLANARVIAVALAAGRQGRLDRVETTSGSDGRYRLDSLIAGTRYFVEAWAEGFAPAGRFVQPKEIDDLDFVLGRSGRVEGRITDAVSGAGIADAEVTVVAGTANTLSPVSTLTDADGRYVLAEVSAGPILLFAAKAEGYPTSWFDLQTGGGRKVVAGETTVVDQVLDPGRVVIGRVRDDAGRGVAYATVAFADRTRRAEGEETALTNVDGAYRVHGLRVAEYEVRVTAPGYAPLDGDQATLEVPEGTGEIRHDIDLAYGANLSGTVVDPYGAPVRGARLELLAPDDRRAQGRVQDLVAVTAASGRWHITGVPPRAPIVVRASHDEWVKAESKTLRLSPGEDRDVPLALGAGVTLTGRVTDPSGRAVPDARVRWGPIGKDDEYSLGNEFRADRLLTPRVVRTSSDGDFTIDRLAPGRLLLKVERDGYAAWIRSDVIVPAEGPAAPVAVELVPSLTIDGRVRDAVTGRPVPEAWIYAREARPDPETEEGADGRVRALVSTQTDEDGRYVLEGLAPGRYEVVVWLAMGYKAEMEDRKDENVRRRDVEGGTKNVDFDLEPLPGGD